MSEEIITPQHAAQPEEDGAEEAAPSPFPKSTAPVYDDEPDDAFTWTASEYIAHHKDMKWYAAVIFITVLVVAFTYLITRDGISAITIFIVGILFCLAAARKPRILAYVLDRDGLTVGQRFYPYGTFKSYSVVREGVFANVELLPLKRFAPLTSLYLPPENEQMVIDILAQHVPYEERPSAYIDRFTRHIRF